MCLTQDMYSLWKIVSCLNGERKCSFNVTVNSCPHFSNVNLCSLLCSVSFHYKEQSEHNAFMLFTRWMCENSENYSIGDGKDIFQYMLHLC